MPKYPTLGEFRIARQLGETNAVLTIDNDRLAAYEDDGEGACVFSMSLLGLPHEHV